uniref:Integrase catalytic domain-containing protein n=1 Tax=Oncorhynchus kisutch TaxID=8019 RepID=A0A8C7DYF8_ONCKI
DMVLERGPLCPLPVYEEPFSHIAMDIVGTLVTSSSMNKYMLVICDYFTLYLEAFSLRNIKAKQVAKALGHFITRVGLPREIITYQGSNFVATLLYKVLGMKSIRSTPYHPETDGLVVRFNQTLKGMLQRFVNESMKNWDTWLLFVYHMHPQDSPHLNSCMTEMYRPSVSHVLQVRDRLSHNTMLGKENMTEAQKAQKYGYDHHSRGSTEGVHTWPEGATAAALLRAQTVGQVRKERKKTMALVRKVEDVEAAEGCFPCEEGQETKPDINHLSGEKKEGLTVNGTKYVVTREDVLYLGPQVAK